MPEPGFYNIIWTGGVLVVRFDEGSPTVTQGGARFEEVTRPKRADVVEFVGSAVYKQMIPSMFDGWSDGTPVDGPCSTLEALANAIPFRIDGPVPHNNIDWYVESVDWGDAIYDGGARVRQKFGLNLIQKADMPAVLGNERRQDLRKIKTVISRTGDLRELAQLVLGDSTLWRRFTNTKGKPFRDWRQKKNVKVRVPQ